MANKENKTNWLIIVIIFLLGVSLAANVFLFMGRQEDQVKIADLEKSMKGEVDKLKADDLALAQAFNNLISQLQALGIIKTTGGNGQ